MSRLGNIWPQHLMQPEETGRMKLTDLSRAVNGRPLAGLCVSSSRAAVCDLVEDTLQFLSEGRASIIRQECVPPILPTKKKSSKMQACQEGASRTPEISQSFPSDGNR